MKTMKEENYYCIISNKIKNELQQSFEDLNGFIVDVVPCGSIDMPHGLTKIAQQNTINICSLGVEPEMVRGLYIDILGCVYSMNGERGLLFISEVKKGKLSLTHLAQLIGYCIASKTRYGLLIGIDKRVTGGFENIVRRNPHLLHFKLGNSEYNIGVGWWNSNTNEFNFDDFGKINSYTHLSRHIAMQLR